MNRKLRVACLVLLLPLLTSLRALAANTSHDVVSTSGANITLNGRTFIPYGLECCPVLAPPAKRTGKLLASYEHFVNSGDQPFENAASWKANLIRFDLSQPGLDPTSPLFSEEYLKQIENVVKLCRDHGFVVMISINDQSPSGDPINHKMPTSATARSWKRLTRVFNSDLGVIYETFSEPQPWPNPENWKRWHNGGADPGGGEPFVGMQSLVDLIRKTGSQNAIVVEGLNWGRTFKGAPEIKDPLNRLIYGVHPYYMVNYCSPKEWDDNFGFLVRQGKPVVATEWCANTGGTVQGCCQGQSAKQMTAKALSLFNFLESRHVGLVVWAFDNPGTVVTDVEGRTPTTYEGFTSEQKGGGPGMLVRAWFRRVNK